ncbi:MAG TPA: hypothetical protein VEB43_02290 [Anaeromyxobacter sp.]|nr:hypothetical protein [Anaeromyxobacter sp.]
MAAAPGLAGAQASSRLAIGTIRGDASQVRRQILLQICGPYECVAASRYTTDDRPDPAKLAVGGVTGYLGGAVTGERGQKRLFLTLTTPSTTAARPARTWKLRLGPDGRLGARALEQFAIELDEVLQGESVRRPSTPAPAAPPQRPAPARPPPAAKAPPPAPKPPPSPPPAAKAPPAARPSEPAARPERAEPPERERPRRRTLLGGAPLRFAAEAGLWVTGRKLSYSGASGGTLRTFDASAIFAPTARLELYPGALAGADRLVAGIGVRADYARSVGLKVKPPAGFTEGEHEATLTALRAAVVWRVQPIRDSGFTLVPALGYRKLQLTTAPKDGVTIEGLPDADLAGVEARLDLEAPVGAFTLLAGAGYTTWTSKGDLVGDGFFGSGSARALQFEGGAEFSLVPPLTIRAVLVYDATSYSGLDDAAAGVGTAGGASDRYLGGRLTLRAEF